MTAPIVVKPMTPGPSGSARAGALTGFTNLATDLDANFNAAKAWATQMQNLMTLKSETTAANVIVPATGWTLHASTAYNVARRIGRLAHVTIAMYYTGTVTTNASGGLPAGNLPMGTVGAFWRPYYNIYPATANGYTGTFLAGSLSLYTNGALNLIGLSAASVTMTNPGFIINLAYFLPPGTV